jgi:hypothetical protein
MKVIHSNGTILYDNPDLTDLSGANLSGANLSGASLRGADLSRADLSNANLSWADLRGTDLRGTDLRGTDLRGTVLDPDATPTGAGHEFARDGEYVFGYRTRKAGHIDLYRDGRCYSADWFSVCPDTECHPGLYLWPTLLQARNYAGPEREIIRVRTRATEVHHAGGKWRCRWFEVMGKAE